MIKRFAAAVVLAVFACAWFGASSALAGTAQTITFPPPPLNPELVGDTWTPAPTSDSTLTVTVTLDASSTGCSIDGVGVVTFTGTGTCIVDANQAGNGTWAPAPQVQVAISVVKAQQTILFNVPNSSPTSGFTPFATASSNLPVFFSVDPLSQGCILSLGQVVFQPGGGVCIIDGDQPGNQLFAPAPTAKLSLVPGKLPNTINATTFPPSVQAGTGQALNGVTTSGNPVVFTIDPTSTGCHGLPGPAVFFDARGGVCVIDANDPGNVNYAPAAQFQQKITIVGGSQQVFFTQVPNQPGIVGSPSGGIVAALATNPPDPGGRRPVLSVDPTSTGCSLLGQSSAGAGLTGAGLIFDSPGVCVIDANAPADTLYEAGYQAQVKIVITKRPNAISFNPPNIPLPGHPGGSYNPSAFATSTFLVHFSIDASTAGNCHVVGGTVFFDAAGICTVNGDDPGDTVWAAAPTAQQKIVVAGLTQTLSFGLPAPTTPGHIGGTYNVSATSTDTLSSLPTNLPVDLTTDVASVGCSLSSGVVTYTAIGLCIIDANQPGNGVYAAALQKQLKIPVVGNTNTITFDSSPTQPATVGTTYTVLAHATSGDPVQFSLDPASAGCTLTGNLVTFTGSGLCIVLANDPGNQNYGAAPQVQQLIQVAKTAQTITFTTTPPSPVAAGSSYPVAATATSGLTVTLTLDAASSGCGLNGHLVMLGAPGVCLIDANQAGDSTYLAAPQAQLAIVIKASQTITFGAPPVTPAVGTTYTPHPTATSSLPVTLSLDGTSTGCTLTAGVVTFTAIGTCVIDGDQAGNSQFAAAPQASQSIVVVPGAQTITFTSTPPVPAGVGGTYNFAATATSGLTVAFTLDGTSTGCSLLGSQVTFTAFGTCVIDANQPGNASWSAAPQTQQTIAISQGSQTITFTSTPPNPALIGGQYNVAATASSGLPVVLTLDPGSVGCGLIGSVVTFFAPGTCVIDANQPGNASFAPALQAQQSIAVRVPQTITFTSTMPVSPVLGTTYTPTATASSGLTVVFSIDGASVGCSLVSGVVHFNKKGTCVLDANQAGNGIFAPAPQVQQLTGSKKPQTITFSSTPPNPGKVGTTYRVSATATSKLAVKLTLDGASTGCTLSGAVVTFTAPGTCRIDADQAGNANWTAATQAQQAITVKRSQTISFSTSPPRATVGGTYTPAATATSGLTVVLTLAASSRGCSLAGGVVSFVAKGTCVIAANQPGNGNFAAAPQVVQSFAIKR